jgi:outer membrane lipoprotein-sorting protein
MGMGRVGRITLVGLMFLAAPMLAQAQTVPVPQPAPKQRTGSVPKPPASILPDTSKTPAPTRQAEPITTEAGQHALVDRVSLYLSTIQTLVGKFVQVGPDGRKTEGSFYIQKPGKVRFEYDPPSPIEVVADGAFVQVRDRSLDTKDTYPLATTPLRYLLADRIDLWRETHLVSVGQDAKYVTVTIEEKSLVVGTHRLMMMFDAKDFQLLQWTVTDPQGYDTTVGVYNLDTNKKPDPNLFRISYGPFDRVAQ